MMRLLLSLGLLGLVSGTFLRANEETAALALYKLGARVVRDDKAVGKPIVSVSLRGVRLEEGDLKALLDLPALRKLDLAGSGVPDAALKHLKNLREINVYGLKVDQAERQALQPYLPGVRFIESWDPIR